MGKRLDWSKAHSKLEAEGCCRNCGATGVKLDCAHIIPRSTVRGHGTVVPPLLIVPLCQGCHRAYDEGKLDLLPVLTVDEQAAAVWFAGNIIRALERMTNTRYYDAGVTLKWGHEPFTGRIAP